MSDSSNRVKPASVAAFLWMPQFGQMFRSSSYLIPTFVRTIAHLFIQAGLLSPTHPSAFYGDPGVEKCGLPKMMGDAWYTLRSTQATPYQWSMFGSVTLMLFVFLVSLASLLFNFSSGVISTATAQQYIFTSPQGETNIASMPGPIAPCNAQTPLCRIIPDEGDPHGDYAIDLLNKMLRQGADGRGGPLQNATGALMEIYNAGILFVAACMLFWLVISVVVDIARTGQVGGGRHNLVWAPIRIVFALGMLVPLGTSGFSSGQFMVMKIAEWGSNFGSNGWRAYLNKVMEDSNVVPKLALGEGLEPLVSSYMKLWICKVAHNGYGYQAEGEAFTTPDYSQFAQIRLDTSSVDKGTMNYAYTNATSGNLCGRVTFPTGNNPVLQGTLNPVSGAAPDPVASAQAQFKVNIERAWMNLFINGYQKGMGPTDPNDPGQNLDQNLPLATLAKQFACGFVAQHIWGEVEGQDVLHIDCSGSQAPQCGSGEPGSGKYPDMSCVDNADNEMDTSTMTGVIGNAIYETAERDRALLEDIPLENLFGTRGWADMGAFFKNLTTLTGTVKYSLAIPVKITAPAIQESGDNQGAKVHELLAKFDDWLKTVPNGQPQPDVPINCNNDPPPDGCPTRSHKGWNPIKSVVNMAKTGVGAVTGLVGAAGDMLEFGKKYATQIANMASDPIGTILGDIPRHTGDLQGTSFLGIPDPTDPEHVNDYPLQILANIGILLMKIATGIYIAVTALEIGLAAIPTVAVGSAVAESMLAHLVNMLGDTLMACGFVLVYYLPMMPYIRVAHAVLVWMIAVFEAVMLLPIACLAFLDTQHEGMYNKLPFINWLDILVRPILTVIGYVGAILVFDAFFGYLQASFTNAAAAEVADHGIIYQFIALVANSVLFCFLAYTAANSSFKMISMIPDAFFRWLPGGSPSGASQLQAPEGAGIMQQVGGMASKSMNVVSGGAKSGAERALLNKRDKDNRGNSADVPKPKDDKDPGTSQG